MTTLNPSFFSQFSSEVIKKQYAENAKGLKQMFDKATLTGKKVNGYTAEQLEGMYKKYTKLSK